MIKGIRGAITVDSNTEESLKDATIVLIQEMLKENNISKDDISHAIFTTTKDITCAFPAKFARIDLGWEKIGMMCYNEMEVDGALQMCLRVLIVVNCNPDFEPKFIYLKGAKNLRK